MLRVALGLVIVLLFGNTRELNWIVFAGMVLGILVMLWGVFDMEDKNYDL